ncbi:MAG: DUF4282 domain-containing protein [Atopobiaceae bacterium]|nr:DUF4282 domain-containing protein [Atopobiaceae bacterium]
MYGYDYGYGYGNPLQMLSNMGVLGFVAFIASIVLTVILYRRYARVPGSRLVNLTDKSTWGPFLRFETLLIERILKVLYIFSMVFVPLALLAGALSSFAMGFGVGMAALVGAIVVTVLAEVGIRLVYEAIMLNVVIARNTSDIKRAMGIADPMDADGISSPAPNMTPTSATATNCSVCGAPIKPGAAFCGNCGSKLG